MIAIYKHDLINVLRKLKETIDEQYIPSEEGKGLSTNDYTDAEKTKLASLPVANDIVTKETGKGLSTNDYTDAEKTKLTSMPAADTIVVVDANGKVPVANLPLEFTALETVATYSDLPVTGLFNGRRIMVLDASGDPTVVSGFAVYVYSSSTSSWTKILEGESMDVSAIVDWSNIQNKPSIPDLSSGNTDIKVHNAHVSNELVIPKLVNISGTSPISDNKNGAYLGYDDTNDTIKYRYNTGSVNTYSTKVLATEDYVTSAVSQGTSALSRITAVVEGSANGTINVTTTTGSSSTTVSAAVHGLQSGAYQKIEVVSALPASPDSDTLYFVLE